ncbi:16S rRNA (guanine(966)-N(2))-methyltransferase RsmD [Bartonella sp. DGB2]|uniref:16S rRNA (guanine(966)-N(2))-methyltransferase RsmD n=1 Tax=Bartonella sp. DGB2 TaxID=3388426 RepID=UPI0039900E2B
MRIVGGKFSGHRLVTPQSLAIRPTSDRTRESLFNILSHRSQDFWRGKRVLDLFAGTGALGAEALSRGAEAVLFVETLAQARGIIQQNIEALSLQGKARILRRDATTLGMAGTIKPFDVVFADPPYGKGLGERAFQSALVGGWTQLDTLFVLEEAMDASIVLDKAFHLLDTRIYGNSMIRFYQTISD